MSATTATLEPRDGGRAEGDEPSTAATTDAGGHKDALKAKHAHAGVAMAASAFAMAAASGLQAVLYLSSFGVNERTDGFFAAFALYATFGIFSQSIRVTSAPLLVGDRPRLTPSELAATLLAISIPVAVLTLPLASLSAKALAPGLDAHAQAVTADALRVLGGAMVLQLWAAGAATLLAVQDRFDHIALAYIAGALAGIAVYLGVSSSAGELSLGWSMLAMAAVTCALMLWGLRGGAGASAGTTRRRLSAHGVARCVALVLGSTAVYLAFNALYLVTVAFASRYEAGDATVLSYAYLYASYLVAGTGFALGMSRMADMRRGVLADWREVIADTVPAGFRYAMMLVAPALAALIAGGAALIGALFPSSLDAAQVDQLRVFAALLCPWTVAALLVNLLLPAMFALGRAQAGQRARAAAGRARRGGHSDRRRPARRRRRRRRPVRGPVRVRGRPAGRRRRSRVRRPRARAGTGRAALRGRGGRRLRDRCRRGQRRARPGGRRAGRRPGQRAVRRRHLAPGGASGEAAGGRRAPRVGMSGAAPAARVARPAIAARRGVLANADARAVAVLSLLFIALAALTWRSWGVPAIDAGAELTAADRIAHGAVAYQDVRYFYGPLGLYSLAGAFELFGTSFTTVFAFGLAQAAAILGAFYALARSGFLPALASCLADGRGGRDRLLRDRLQLRAAAHQLGDVRDPLPAADRCSRWRATGWSSPGWRRRRRPDPAGVRGDRGAGLRRLPGRPVARRRCARRAARGRRGWRCPRLRLPAACWRSSLPGPEPTRLFFENLWPVDFMRVAGLRLAEDVGAVRRRERRLDARPGGGLRRPARGPGRGLRALRAQRPHRPAAGGAQLWPLAAVAAALLVLAAAARGPACSPMPAGHGRGGVPRTC